MAMSKDVTADANGNANWGERLSLICTMYRSSSGEYQVPLPLVAAAYFTRWPLGKISEAVGEGEKKKEDAGRGAVLPQRDENPVHITTRAPLSVATATHGRAGAGPTR